VGFDCTQHWVNTADQERILRALEEAEAAGNMALTADVELGRKRMHAQASALPPPEPSVLAWALPLAQTSLQYWWRNGSIDSLWSATT
jgi:hypothetical protein